MVSRLEEQYSSKVCLATLLLPKSNPLHAVLSPTCPVRTSAEYRLLPFLLVSSGPTERMSELTCLRVRAAQRPSFWRPRRNRHQPLSLSCNMTVKRRTNCFLPYVMKTVVDFDGRGTLRHRCAPARRSTGKEKPTTTKIHIRYMTPPNIYPIKVIRFSSIGVK